MNLKERYEAIKQRTPNIILLFKRGDTYECYEQDARIVSMYLGATPMIHNPDKVLFCCFNYLALSNLQKQLRKIGFEVALNFEL